MYKTAFEHYGSWEQLLALVEGKVAFYAQLRPTRDMMAHGLLRPAYICDPTHPAYFSDEIALRCLRSYDPQESDHAAMERCMANLLHESMEKLEAADPSPVMLDGYCWEQYLTDSLLRLAWRQRRIPCRRTFYLKKEGENALADSFELTATEASVTLTRSANGRPYEFFWEQLVSYEAFFEALCQAFRLATEEDGYFVPTFLWLPTDPAAYHSCP